MYLYHYTGQSNRQNIFIANATELENKTEAPSLRRIRLFGFIARKRLPFQMRICFYVYHTNRIYYDVIVKEFT